MNRKYIWAIIYGVILLGFTIFMSFDSLVFTVSAKDKGENQKNIENSNGNFPGSGNDKHSPGGGNYPGNWGDWNGNWNDYWNTGDNNSEDDKSQDDNSENCDKHNDYPWQFF